MRNYGQIRKLVACTVEVAIARLLTFLFFDLPIKLSLMNSPSACANFDFTSYALISIFLMTIFSDSQDFFHSRTNNS